MVGGWLGGVTPAGATGHGSLPAALQCPHSHWPSARVHKPLYEHELGRGVTGKEGQGWLRHLPAALAAARPLESDLVAAGWGEDGLVCAHVYLLRKVGVGKLFSVRSQMVSILGFVGQNVFVTVFFF